MKLRHILFIFLPAIFLVALTLFIRLVQYNPIDPPIPETAAEEIKKSTIPIFPEDPILGLKTAPQTLILFGDFGCENCKVEYELLHTILEQYPNKVKVIWKGLPVITLPFNTELAQKYGFCAHKQNKFESFASFAFENSSSLSEATLKSISTQVELNESQLKTCLIDPGTSEYIQKTKDLAQVLNIQTVPTVFLNNVQISSPQSVEEWKAALSL